MEPNAPLYDLAPVSCTEQHSSALAALRLLRSYNHFLVPPDQGHHRSVLCPDVHGVVPLLASLPQPPCLPYCQHLPVRAAPPVLSPASGSGDGEARRRGEKRPIPIEMKDEKYFERRRRNNQAAKKSRDARRIREDQIAWRACFLEQENASLRAHIAALRQEAFTLRALLAHSPHGIAHGERTAQNTHTAPSSTTAD